MNKRQAKIEAIKFAVGLLQGDVNSSDEMYESFEDGAKVHNALEDLITELELRAERLENNRPKPRA